LIAAPLFHVNEGALLGSLVEKEKNIPSQKEELTPQVKDESAEKTSNEESVKEVPSILLDIAKCESGDRQFNEDGEVIRGRINPLDIGRFQINLHYHGDRAKELGIDLFTLEGNTEYALMLYKEQGTQPWLWSAHCWSKKEKYDK